MLDHRSTEDPLELATSLTLLAVADESGALKQWCADALKAMPAEVESVRAGRVNVLNKIIGRVMKTSRGTADAQAVRTMLMRMLQPH